MSFTKVFALSAVVAGVAGVAGVGVSAAGIPEQIHLSWTGKRGEMAVDFVASAGGQEVKYTPAKGGATTTLPADCTPQTLNGYSAFFCTALMKGIKANIDVTYTVGSAATGYSAPYTFTNERAGSPLNFCMYADFGLGNDESLAALIKAGANKEFDAVIHAGDFAYDFDDQKSATGNGFMNSVQPYAATVPYMASPGNHEAYGTQGGGAFAQFATRYNATAKYAGRNSGSDTNFWYSFETPLVHWLAFTAETWTMSQAQLDEQLAFVKADLAKVDRAATPWVVAFSHKSYMMDQTTWSLHDFLADYNVDLQFVGHWHQYTRYPPIDSRNNKVVIDSGSVSADTHTYTSPKYPIVVVVGAPGDVEVNPRTCNEANQIVCSGNYGFGYFSAVSATKAVFSWNTTVPVAGSPDPTFSDYFTIIKN